MNSIEIEKLRQEDGKYRWEKEKVEVNKDGDDFTLNEHKIDWEAYRLPGLIAHYGQIQSELKAEITRKTGHLEKIFAFKAETIRQSTDEKLSDKKIEGKVLLTEEYQEALADLNISRLFYYQADNWWRSIQRKADLLQAIIYRQNAELRRLE